MTGIYRLKIIYPEGSHEPGWCPPVWSNPRYLETLSWKERRALKSRVFAWPRVRNYLSSSGAYQRAWLFRFYGADCEVEASRPVEWPNWDDPDSLDPRAWEWAPSAARWNYWLENRGGAQLEDDDIESMREQLAEIGVDF